MQIPFQKPDDVPFKGLFKNRHTLELIAAIVTLLCVWLTAKAHVACWPVGILGCLLYSLIFYRSRLYSDVLLQFYFLITSIYGWYNWLFGGSNHTQLAVRSLTGLERFGMLLLVLAGTLLLGRIMRRTRAVLPFADAGTTALSLVAQYLLTEMYWESWVFWIIADIVDTGIYFSRRLYVTSLLYFLLLILAIQGLLEWLHKI